MVCGEVICIKNYLYFSIIMVDRCLTPYIEAIQIVKGYRVIHLLLMYYKAAKCTIVQNAALLLLVPYSKISLNLLLPNEFVSAFVTLKW